ncbi:NAD(P)/FAD-dependent oxidoreductase [Curtobacterium sp. RRHDQ10]|uniref:NAD(P)/FAD-dependent oxidoreductase n=1 Tax=Curtobacterium phyllosphaerae TaxID=3413379 RepID=UPI003BF44E89
MEQNTDRHDVVVVGGGAAGLSAALVLGRSRRSVLLVDAGDPRNARAAGVHNYLGQEGTAPAELSRIGRAEVTRYGVEIADGRVVAASAVRADTADGDHRPAFRVVLDSGRVVEARRLVVASGSVDVLPDVPGLAEQWGRGVVHCPYCHGWEVRDRRIGVLLTSAIQVHQAQLFRQLSDDVTVFATDPALLDDDARRRLDVRGIVVVDGPVARVVSTDDVLTAVELADGRLVEVDALAASSTVEARVDFLAGLGLEPEDQVVNGARFGSVLPTGPTGETSVRGVWAAGNPTNVATIVIAASAAGTGVGAQVHADLVAEDVELALRDAVPAG